MSWNDDEPVRTIRIVVVLYGSVQYVATLTGLSTIPPVSCPMGVSIWALAAALTFLSSFSDGAIVSNVIPRRDTSGAIVNAHAGGIYIFRRLTASNDPLLCTADSCVSCCISSSGKFYLIGEHYRDCPHAGANKTRDPLAVGDCEMCGHTGSSSTVLPPDRENDHNAK